MKSFALAALLTAPVSQEARFLLVGDTGSGNATAHAVAAALGDHAGQAGAAHVFFLGDNVYEEGEAEQIEPRFLDVYRGVFALGVTPHAALGNHDVENCRGSDRHPVPRDGAAYAPAADCWVEEHLDLPEFGYRHGFRYYSVEVAAPLVEVFVLDTNTLGEDQNRLGRGADQAQLEWLDQALERSTARWKVVAMHHPMYAPERCRFLEFGCRGPDETLRSELEPIFVERGVDVVFQAHQHFYARLHPQRGVRYFVTGAGGKDADSARPDRTAVWRDDRGAFNHFMAARVTGESFGYCVVDLAGEIRDRGSFLHRDSPEGQSVSDPCASP